MDYHAPLADMAFVVKELLGLDETRKMPGFEEVSEELFDAVQEESARFSREVLSPLNAVGDRQPATLQEGRVVTPQGFRAAYQKFLEGGWNGLTCPVDYGGQGLPNIFAAPLEEMWHGSNMAFTLGPLLTRGAIEAIHYAGTEAQRQRYLPDLVSGRWMGTMNLTEPQAGSDLAALRSHAVAEGTDHYLITGQKIFITYGDQDWSENIIHLVLARLPDAPAGVRGLSLFIVPKVRVDEAAAGIVNDVHTVSLEHKLGIHGSPTCMMSYGDHGGAWGELLGQPHRGLELMFVMMNAARFSVGVQGLAIAERAYQGALDYARTRVQGIPVGSTALLPIVHHGDVARMLAQIKAHIEAGRALAYYAGWMLDLAHQETDEARRTWAQARSDLLTPLVKGHCTEMGVWAASEALQVYGGMGFIEETGVAQHYRDARITTIYEGTTGIQANDLVGRKLLRDRGQGVRNLLEEIARTLPQLHQDPQTPTEVKDGLSEVLEMAQRASLHLLQGGATNPAWAFAVAVPYLHLMSHVVTAWLMARSYAVATLAQGNQSAEFYGDKKNIVSFYMLHVLPQCRTWMQQIEAPAEVLDSVQRSLVGASLSSS
ncbi:MAG: acyl-CoA dehydrogenase [Ferrovum sp.]|nr:acyl-CoA dehydrogenase [Ferrovum sp.]NDU87508.1 acyl-CoA dehydrogenase [Ferrovum sp.]